MERTKLAFIHDGAEWHATHRPPTQTIPPAGFNLHAVEPMLEDLKFTNHELASDADMIALTKFMVYQDPDDLRDGFLEVIGKYGTTEGVRMLLEDFRSFYGIDRKRFGVVREMARHIVALERQKHG
jgi:hypothetical protein